MDENIITWNVTNWVTITLMAALGFAVLAVVASLTRGKIGMSGDSLPVAEE